MSLTRRLLAGTALAAALSLSGCQIKTQLPGVVPTGETYQRARWITVPFGDIWTPYMGEKRIAKSKDIWGQYMQELAERNGFIYEEKNGITYIVGYNGKTMGVPDLDNGDGVEIKLNGVKTRVD